MSSDRRDMAAPALTGDPAFQATVLEDMSAAENYRSWLIDLTAPYLGDCPVEIGSGTGDYAELWAGAGRHVTATDGFPPLVDQLRQRFATNPFIDVQQLVIPSSGQGDHSAAVAINVLEHIPDDLQALRAFAALVRPGGAVVLFVPAFSMLMSDYDRRVGHVRRYRRKHLLQLLHAAGLEPTTVHYVNTVGFFGWLVKMRLLRGQPGPGFALTVFDRGILPIMRMLEARIRAPFGQSLLAVATKP